MAAAEEQDSTSERAIDAPGVRSALRRSTWRAIGLIVLGGALLWAFGSMAVDVETGASDLQRTGRRVPGTVAAVDPGLRTPGSIQVRYSDGGAELVMSVTLDSDSRDYDTGDRVMVIIDRDDPTRTTIVGETNQSPASVLVMIAFLIGGFVLLCFGAPSIVMGIDRRRVLRSGPWRREPIRYAEIPAGRSVRSIVLLVDARGDHVLQVSSANIWRLRRSGLRDRSTAEVVGDPGRRVVLRTGPGGALLRADRPWSARAATRWKRRAFPDLR